MDAIPQGLLRPLIRYLPRAKASALLALRFALIPAMRFSAGESQPAFSQFTTARQPPQCPR
jgi:hypothetical protein